MKTLRIILIFYFLLPVAKAFPLEPLNEKELKTTTGQAAMTDFTIIDNSVNVFLNTHIETWTEIDSMKLGYYNRQTPGWDQDWTNISFGSQSSDMTIDGLILKAEFDDLNSNSPTLNSIMIGTNRINGTIKGNFNSFTGIYNPELTGGKQVQNKNQSLYNIRKNLGNMEFNFDSTNSNKGFFIILSPQAAKNGIHAILGYSESTMDKGWWDSP